MLGCARCTFLLVGCWALATDSLGPEAATSVGVSGNLRVMSISHVVEVELQRRTSGWLWARSAALTYTCMQMLSLRGGPLRED